jgi:long-chain acyl-CoA synthetase
VNEAIWLASYPPGVPKSVDIDAYSSLHALLLDACDRFRDRPAFSCLGTTITYSEWERDSRSFAAFLCEEVHCRPGDRIALMLPNVLAYPVAFLGALRAGLIVVNVNPLYTPRELQCQLQDSGARIIVIMENFAHKLAATIAETNLDHVIVARLGDLAAPPKRWLLNFVNAHVRHAVPPWSFERFTMLQDACKRPAPSTFVDTRPNSSEPAMLQYTGGTTGIPKGAVLSHRNLVANTLQCKAWVSPNVEPGFGRVLTPLPLYHIFSLTANMLTFASLGGLSVLVPDPRNLPRLIATMHKSKVTAMTGVNTLFNALNNAADLAKVDLGRLKFAIGGGAAVQRSVAIRWQQATGSPLVEGYGLTEASPVVCINPIDTPRIGSVGLPIPLTEVTIHDDAGGNVGTGESGEVWVRGPQVMQGYWEQPEETRRVLTEDGWLRTGDIGFLDPQGFLTLQDRKKDMIIVSGFKVFPNEVEDVVMQHSGILEAAALGVPDERTGEAVKLFVVRRDPELTRVSVLQFCRDNLAGYKVPRIIEFREALPKSPVGKILRKELR